MYLPQPIKDFAQKYFNAQDRAVVMPNFGAQFLKKDRKELARECKLLLESGGVENLAQLAMDLHSIRPDLTPGANRGRLERFAKQCNVTYGKPPKEVRAKPVRKPQVAQPGSPVSIRSELIQSFQKWLAQGMSLKALQQEAHEVLLDVNNKAQEAQARMALQDLMRNTGMTASRIANIAQSL